DATASAMSIGSPQYSDPVTQVTITGNDIDSLGSSLIASAKWSTNGGATFTNGLLNGLTLTPGTPTLTSETWTLGGVALVAPGTYLVRVTVDDNYGPPYQSVG